jgi:hypothetical protein
MDRRTQIEMIKVLLKEVIDFDSEKELRIVTGIEAELEKLAEGEN